MSKRVATRTALIVVALWTVFQAFSELLGIPSRFADVWMLPPWLVFRITDADLHLRRAYPRLALFALVNVAAVLVLGVAWRALDPRDSSRSSR